MGLMNCESCGKELKQVTGISFLDNGVLKHIKVCYVCCDEIIKSDKDAIKVWSKIRDEIKLTMWDWVAIKCEICGKKCEKTFNLRDQRISRPFVMRIITVCDECIKGDRNKIKLTMWD